jgi:hypothetical protein
MTIPLITWCDGGFFIAIKARRLDLVPDSVPDKAGTMG